MKIAITGHRPNKLGNDYQLTSPLLMKIKGTLQFVIEKKQPSVLISGMALGIDTLWAKLAIENNIKLIAAIPCANQEWIWKSESQQIYRSILAHHLTETVYVSEDDYNATCMQLRNEWMVDNCDLLVAVWDGTSGGTANCVKYAESVGKTIIQINPDDERRFLNPDNQLIRNYFKKS